MSSPAAADTVGDLNLLREWREPINSRRVLIDAAGSLTINLVLFVSVVSMRGTPAPRFQRDVPDVRKAVHLVLPRFSEPTQKAPNKGKVTRELDVRSSNPAPAPQSPKFLPPQPAPGPAVSTAQPVPTPVIEQPKIQVAANPPPPVIAPQPQQPVQQPVAAAEPQKPKLSFESVGAQSVTVVPPNPVKLPMPNRSVGGGGTIVGDIGDSTTIVPNINNTPSTGRIGSNLQLLSDPRGIDFKPYLIQILTAVRRNWLSIIPESARMGRRGRVLIQFAIDRTGGVPKLVIAEGAGAGNDTLDRAAVSAISASYPFPPLPADYNGDQIRVQLAFSYNLPSK
jgi:protein TonB